MEGDEARTAILLCLLCLLGSAGSEVLKQFGVRAGTKYSATLLNRLPVAIVDAIKRKAGFALVAEYGTKRAVVTPSGWTFSQTACSPGAVGCLRRFYRALQIAEARSPVGEEPSRA